MPVSGSCVLNSRAAKSCGARPAAIWSSRIWSRCVIKRLISSAALFTQRFCQNGSERSQIGNRLLTLIGLKRIKYFARGFIFDWNSKKRAKNHICSQFVANGSTSTVPGESSAKNASAAACMTGKACLSRLPSKAGLTMRRCRCQVFTVVKKTLSPNREYKPVVIREDFGKSSGRCCKTSWIKAGRLIKKE